MDHPWIPSAPFPHLETHRLILREIRETDFPHFLELFQSEEVNTHIQLNWGEPEEARKIFQTWKTIWENGQGVRWSIILKVTGEWVGNFGFKEPRLKEKCVERGLQISPSHWRKGYGNEASQAAMNWLRSATPYRQVDSWIAQTNQASIALIQKQGFCSTGEIKSEYGLVLERFVLEFF